MPRRSMPLPGDPVPIAPAQLRAARARAGDSQETAARRVYASCAAWRRWEAGTRPIPLATAHLYALLTGQPWPLALARAA